MASMTANTPAIPPATPTTILGTLRALLVSFVILTAITGLLYPLVVTGIAQVAFRHQAEGSLIDKNGNPTQDESAAVGSSLIGQTFDQPQYFRPRPSATNSMDTPPQPLPYNAANSSGSNTGPSSIADSVNSRVTALQQADKDAGVINTAPVPIDLVTASGSGLDPHESVAAARYQIPRIAALRHIPPETLEALIAAHTEPPVLGLLGEKVVNVLALNLDLDRKAPYHAPASEPASASAPGTHP